MSSYRSPKSIVIEKTKLNADEIKAWNKLMSIFYSYPENEPPKLDRTYFWCGNIEEQEKIYNK